MSTAVSSKFQLPRLVAATLRGFTLFSQTSTIELSLEKRVFCLAGANGLGKSTFMAALNFGFTGRVAEPGRPFRSVEEYFRHTEEYAARYFDGRIGELDREEAEIELDFSIGDVRFRLTRGMFETAELRQLTITEGETPIDIDESYNPAQLNDIYGQKVAAAAGLHSFEQFVFLQLFLLTFDERRTLTFWEPLILEQLLQLAFGFDPEEAQEADSLRRLADRRGSNARNLNYQATDTRRRLRDVERFLSKQDPIIADLLEEHKELEERRKNVAERYISLGSDVRDARLSLATLSAKASEIQSRFEEVFTSRGKSQHRVDFHPLVVQSVAEGFCKLCGTDSEMAVSVLRNRVSGSECPLCGSPTSEAEDSEDFLVKLRQLDGELVQTRMAVKTEQSKVSRLENEHDKLGAQLGQIEQEIGRFETDNDLLAVLARDSEESSLLQVAESYRLRIKELDVGKVDARRERDRALRRLKSIQDAIGTRYRAAEGKFLPSFQQLAFAFLGLDLNIKLESRSAQMRLVLEVDGQPRRQEHELSESQRFFLDIALRMSVANYITGDGRTSTMFIDTPEGSLDAAYESRAGEMFAQFVEQGNHIVMTANINTSQLLRRMASRCGSAFMHLERMTEWAQLSEVQIAEEGLFDEAYGIIEEALAGDLIA